jgi:muramoyltetrapeptide carboxypeptidase
MIPMKLKAGETIGLISPSHIASADRYAGIIAGIEANGFQVKTGEHLYKSTYGYSAAEMERAHDLNQMVLDEAVKLVFFGGGYGSIELLPYIDYEAVKRHPKLFLSYSDGTSILNAIYARTGLITYYGQMPGLFDDIKAYNLDQFMMHMVRGNPEDWVSNSQWHCLNEGVGEGILLGGYTVNFALMVNSSYFDSDTGKKVVLFLEDYEKYSSVACVSMLLAHIEQSPLIHRISGLLFGHYSEPAHPDLLERLKRFGVKHNVPVAYCDDFGHGSNKAILPIGCHAVLNTKEKTMKMYYPAVSQE